MHTSNLIVAALLTSVAGLPASVLAQSGALPSRTTPDQRTTTTAATRGFDLTTCDRLLDRDVVNPQGEEIGSIEDLIVSRSSGEILYAVLKSGAVLGIGGKTVAMPYRQLRWDEANNRFALSMTEDQVQALPEFNADHWEGLEKPDSGLRTWLNRQFEESDRPERDRAPVSTANAQTVRGRIVSVERSFYGPHGEDVVIVVQTDKGAQERVLLGPSWYVMGAEGAPMRDSTVNLTAVRQDGPVGWVAVKGDMNGAAMNYRDAQGRPAWTGDSPESRAWRDRGPGARLVLVSDVKGADVQCRGDSCGTVDEVIIDRRSGRALMLSIDPDENILGIGDDNRLAPWTIAYLGVDGVVNIDADKQMITGSVVTPDDFQGYRELGAVERVYSAFHTPMPGSRNDPMGGEPRPGEMRPGDTRPNNGARPGERSPTPPRPSDKTPQ